MSLKNPILSLEYVAGGTITEGQILKHSSDTAVVAAAAATDKIIGVAEHAAASAATVRVQLMGRAKVKAGGTIARGDLVTSDASGLAVAAAPGAGVNNRILGVALQAAVSGDEFSVLLAQCEKQGA